MQLARLATAGLLRALAQIRVKCAAQRQRGIVNTGRQPLAQRVQLALGQL